MKLFLITGLILVFIVLTDYLCPGPLRHMFCGSEADVIPIAYGLPGLEAMKQAQRGEVYLGGCMVERERWYCRKCKSRW